jgi:hypothetical protein
MILFDNKLIAGDLQQSTIKQQIFGYESSSPSVPQKNWLVGGCMMMV